MAGWGDWFSSGSKKSKREKSESAYVTGGGMARKAADSMRSAYEKKAEKLNSIMDEINATRGGKKQ